IGRSTNQFGISRDGKDAFHPFQVDWTHLIASLDKLVIMNTGVYSLFALQAGRVHLTLLLALENSCTLSYLHMEISTKLYVAGYKNVKAKSFGDSPYARRGFVILSAAKDLVPTYGNHHTPAGDLSS